VPSFVPFCEKWRTTMACGDTIAYKSKQRKYIPAKIANDKNKKRKYYRYFISDAIKKLPPPLSFFMQMNIFCTAFSQTAAKKLKLQLRLVLSASAGK